jgi:RNA 2',3'-cyclic 3'-phosphodiesterase
MRLFIALDLDEHKNYFNNIQNELKNIEGKLSYPKSYHITLKFIGEFDDNKADIIKDILKNIEFKKFKIILRKLGVYPNEKYIKVVWLGAKPEEHINKLKQDIDKRLEQLNFKPQKSFKVHITIARVKNIKDKQALLDKINELKLEEKEITINNFKLIKSELTPSGPIYEEVAVFS